MSGLLDRLFPPPQPAASAPLSAVSEDSFRADLSSVIRGGKFQAVFTVRWTGRGVSTQAEQVWLRQFLLRHAEACTSRVSVAEVAATEIHVNARLQELTRSDTGHIHVVSADVRLSATADAHQAAERWERLQSQREVSRLDAELEIERLRHLRDDIFRKPEVARTYWLDRHPESLEGALDDRFERIAEKLGSGPAPSTTTIAHLLRDFLIQLSPDDKATLVGMLGQAFVAYGRPELRDKLPSELT